MSQDADTIRQHHDARNAFMRGELSGEGYAERLDPQIELLWRDRQTYPDFPQHLRGLAEYIDHLEQLRDGWIDFVSELLELIEVPDGRAVALVRQSGRGRQSGVPVVFHYFALHTIRDGKVRKIEFFRHRADALQAAGLGEQAMSENLELVRSIYAAWERGDYSSAEWADPEIEYVWADGPAPSRSRGLAGLAESARGMFNAWEGLRVEAEQYRELDGERVLVLQRFAGRGKTSGVELAELHAQGAGLFHVRRGKVVRVVAYLDRGNAFADLGLTPEGDAR